MKNADEIQETQSSQATIRANRIQKLTDLADIGINPYPYSFDKDASASFLQEKYKDLPAGTEAGQPCVSGTGRWRSRRAEAP